MIIIVSRKIDAMYETYGHGPNQYCKTCCNLIHGDWHGRAYNKFCAYGLIHSEATDWKVSNKACGLYNKKFYEKQPTVLERIKRASKGKQQVNEVIEGQLSF